MKKDLFSLLERSRIRNTIKLKDWKKKNICTLDFSVYTQETLFRSMEEDLFWNCFNLVPIFRKDRFFILSKKKTQSASTTTLDKIYRFFFNLWQDTKKRSSAKRSTFFFSHLSFSLLLLSMHWLIRTSFWTCRQWQREVQNTSFTIHQRKWRKEKRARRKTNPKTTTNQPCPPSTTATLSKHKSLRSTNR